MKAFHLSIRIVNDAFADDNYDFEIARILRETADRIETNGAGTCRHKIHDLNGNHVGSYNTET